jgi:HsdM-like protein
VRRINTRGGGEELDRSRFANSPHFKIVMVCATCQQGCQIRFAQADRHRAWQEQNGVSNGDLGWITNFIWGIADDVLRDLYVRGKYRDVILPMTVLRRLDAVLEPKKAAVIEMTAALDHARITNQDAALRQAAVRPSTTPRALRCAIFEPERASSSSGPTSRLIWTVSHQTCRKSSIASSSAISSRGPTRSVH